MSRRKKNEMVVDDDFEEDGSSERLSVWDAADIWASTHVSLLSCFIIEAGGRR